MRFGLSVFKRYSCRTILQTIKIQNVNQVETKGKFIRQVVATCTKPLLQGHETELAKAGSADPRINAEERDACDTVYRWLANLKKGICRAPGITPLRVL